MSFAWHSFFLQAQHNSPDLGASHVSFAVLNLEPTDGKVD
jgi:hypothetical protein